MQTYIENPKTGKLILVDGPTYNLLLKSTTYAAKVKKAKRIEMPAKSTHQKQFGKTTKPSDVKLSKAKTTQKSGNKMKGWKGAAPKRGTEREALKAKCGSECFLKPDSNGFPICQKLRSGSNSSCKVDCRGIIAAKVRAGIWDYKDVQEAAEMLSKKYGC